jgi:hypothetical protein
MNETFFIKRGDTSPAVRYALEPLDTNLTGATVRFQMRTRGGAQVLDAPAQVITATLTPTVQYAWQPSDTATAGQFEAEFRILYADASIETFPNSGFISIRVAEDVR